MKALVTLFLTFCALIAPLAAFGQSETFNSYQIQGVSSSDASGYIQPVCTISGSVAAGTYVLQGYWVDQLGTLTTGTAALCTTVFGQSGYSSITVGANSTITAQNLSPFHYTSAALTDWYNLHGNTNANFNWTFYATSLTSSSGTYSAQGTFVATTVWTFESSNLTPASPQGNTVNMNVTILGTGSPLKTPEPLNISITNKNSTSQEVEVFDPNGNTVATYGVGANQVLNTVFTPAALAGTYSFGYLVNGQASTLTQMNLTATSTDPQYSYVWSDNSNDSASISATINGGASGNQGTNGSFTNNSGRAVTLEWQDSQGNAVGSPWTVQNGQTSPINGVPVTLPAGGSGVYSLVDTTDGKTLGTVTESNLDGIYQGAGQITATANPPASANPTPTPNPTNTGNNPVGVSCNNTPATTSVNNGNTSISGNSTGATNQDIYNDVKQALLDASSGNPADGTGDQMPADAQVISLTGVQADQATVQNWAQNQINTGSSGFGAAPSAPSIGATSYGFTVPSIGTLAGFTVNWSSYASEMNIFRTLCLVAMCIIFWLGNQRAVSEAVG